MTDPLTLREFYENSCRADLELELSGRRLAVYDNAIATFDAFAGGNLPIESVTERQLSRYVRQGATERSQKYLRELALCVRKVVRSWRLDALKSPREFVERRLPPAECTVRAFYETVYRPTRMVGMSDQYKFETRRAFERMADCFGRDILLDELSDSIAAEFFQWLLDQGLRAITVNRYRAYLLAVWRHAYMQREVDVEPRVPKLSVERREPDALTLEQFGDVLDAALRFQPNRRYEGIRRNLWWHAHFLTAYWTGLRRSALLAIRRTDVDLETGWLNVQPSCMKNKRGKKFRLGQDALDAIAKIWLPHRSLLFPKGCNIRQLDNHFAWILADAGIPRGKGPCGNHWHLIRRTVATHAWLASGIGTASALLGHSSEQITLRYLDPSFAKGNDATEFLPQLRKQKPR